MSNYTCILDIYNCKHEKGQSILALQGYSHNYFKNDYKMLKYMAWYDVKWCFCTNISEVWVSHGMLISILMGLCKGNLWPKIILIMICLDISSLFFGLYYDFSHCIYIGIYISFDINKAPRSCLATAGRAPEAVPFQTFKCMLHIFRRIFQKSLISYRDFHAISEHGPSIPGNSPAQWPKASLRQ